MHGAPRLAVGILAIWFAGFLFYVSFSPMGLLIQDPTTGANRAPENPGEVLSAILARFSASPIAQSNPPTTPTTSPANQGVMTA